MNQPDPKVPGQNPAPGFERHPEHEITMSPYAGKVVVRSGETVLASTVAAIELLESGHAPVLYIPFSDIEFARLTRTATSTHCPFKGDASYWRAGLPGDDGPDVMWAYERPFDEMEAIRDHGAFYPDRVTIEA